MNSAHIFYILQSSVSSKICNRMKSRNTANTEDGMDGEKIINANTIFRRNCEWMSPTHGRKFGDITTKIFYINILHKQNAKLRNRPSFAGTLSSVKEFWTLRYHKYREPIIFAILRTPLKQLFFFFSLFNYGKISHIEG